MNQQQSEEILENMFSNFSDVNVLKRTDMLNIVSHVYKLPMDEIEKMDVNTLYMKYRDVKFGRVKIEGQKELP